MESKSQEIHKELEATTAQELIEAKEKNQQLHLDLNQTKEKYQKENEQLLKNIKELEATKLTIEQKNQALLKDLQNLKADHLVRN